MEQEITDLKNRISNLENFVSEKKRQQLIFPLDGPTQDIIKDKKVIAW